MISIQSAVEAHELVELAREIQEHRPALDWQTAFELACQELPIVMADIQADARWKPARVVLFDGDGRPMRVPNMLTPAELLAFTGGDNGR